MKVKRLKYVRPATTGVFALCVAVTATMFSSVAPASALTSAAPASGLAFYKGKTITLIAPDSPGGSFDEWDRLIAPYLAKYLGATVNVENVPAGNTVAGQDAVASANPDGLTMGLMNTSVDIGDKIAGAAGVNFDPTKDVEYAGTIGGQTPSVWITHSSSGIKTWGDLIKSKTPVKIPVLTNIGTTTTIINKLGIYTFNIPHQFITGYESSAALVQGFVRGDGNLLFENLVAAGQLITSGKATAIATNVPVTSGAYEKVLAKVPDVAQLAKMYPPKTKAEKQALKGFEDVLNFSGDPFFMPKGVPADRVAAVAAALKTTMANKAFQAQVEKQGLVPGYESPKTTLAQYKAFVKVLTPLKSVLLSK